MSSVAAHAASAEQRERFERDGFLVLDSTGCDSAVLDGIVSDVEDRYLADTAEGEWRRKSGVVYYSRRIQDAWRVSDNVRELALSPTVLSLLTGLYGRRPLPFQTLNFRKGSEQAVHSDALHFNSMPAGFMCGVWVALEDIDMRNGPLVYYPGSHKRAEITMQDVGVPAREDEYGHYERFIAETIEREGLEADHGTIRKGQAFVWAANLLHGGMRQADPTRTRHSQVTHYFFEGCRYYTPMSSGEGHVRWRNPTWISDEAAAQDLGAFDYDAEHVRSTVIDHVPAGATVVVASRGDDELMTLSGRTAWHIPSNPDGTYAGYHPADGVAVIHALAELREAGARYFVLPSASFWWLEHYTELSEHLDSHCEVLSRDGDCILYAL